MSASLMQGVKKQLLCGNFDAVAQVGVSLVAEALRLKHAWFYARESCVADSAGTVLMPPIGDENMEPVPLAMSHAAARCILAKTQTLDRPYIFLFVDMKAETMRQSETDKLLPLHTPHSPSTWYSLWPKPHHRFQMINNRIY